MTQVKCRISHIMLKIVYCKGNCGLFCGLYSMLFESLYYCISTAIHPFV